MAQSLTRILGITEALKVLGLDVMACWLMLKRLGLIKASTVNHV